MNETARLIASIIVLFGASLFVSYCVMWLVSEHKSNVELAPNTSIRLIGLGGAYRCHYREMRGKRIVVTSPLQADRYVPIRVGEKLLVQASGTECMLTFRTTVVERNSTAHELILEPPTYVRRTERRSEGRSHRLRGEDALIEGELASVVDLSAAGACVVTRRRTNPGERLRFVLPSSGLDAFGWALESTNDAYAGRKGYKVRIQFEEPLAGLLKRPRPSDA